MTDPVRAPLVESLASAWPLENWHDLSVLVAVSGGADSVALACALAELRGTNRSRLVLAHFNHRLRGNESDADQAFVQQLARELNVEVIISSSPHLSLSHSPPLPSPSEESLRNARYQFLSRAAGQCGARYVATAHTADDQIETVLFNILRGTGLAGLAGIPRVRALSEAASLVRPLLAVSRAQVLEYLQQLGQSYRTDSTNAHSTYTRNRIRNELLPLLEREYNPHVREALARLSRIAGEADDLVEHNARWLLSRARRLFGEDVEIQTHRLQRAPDLVARAALVLAWKWQGWPLADMGFDKWDELLSYARLPVDAPAPARTFPGNIRAERRGRFLKLTRITGQSHG